jgi:hypothetical protein
MQNVWSLTCSVLLLTDASPSHFHFLTPVTRLALFSGKHKSTEDMYRPFFVLFPLQVVINVSCVPFCRNSSKKNASNWSCEILWFGGFGRSEELCLQNQRLPKDQRGKFHPIHRLVLIVKYFFPIPWI